MTSKRASAVAQQPMRARHVAAGQHEAVAALGQRVQQSRAARGAGRGSFRTSAARALRRAGTSPGRSPARARVSRRSVRSNASRAERRLASPASAVDVNGDAAATARWKRSGVLAARSTSMYWHWSRPSRSASACSSVVRPVPQPPSTTGMRGGRRPRARPGRAARVRRGEPSSARVSSMGIRHSALARGAESLRDTRRRRAAPRPVPGSHVSTRASRSSASREPSATITMPA